MNNTKEHLARALNGREMGSEITTEEEAAARTCGLVVLFGYSDDNAEFRGAIEDEIGCYGGGNFFVHKDGVMSRSHEYDCPCEYCGFELLKSQCAQIHAKWDAEGYSWIYATDIPHARFDIMEGEEKYCRGIVFERSALPTTSVEGGGYE